MFAFESMDTLWEAQQDQRDRIYYYQSWHHMLTVLWEQEVISVHA